jgi:RNA polymerase sigma-70 factor (ECF subfamily)
MATGLAYRLLVGSGVDVEDLLQDAFVTAFSRLDSLREPEAFSSWLGSIVVRTASKRLRRQRLRLRFGLVRNEPVDLDLCVASSAPPDAALLLREIYAILDQLRPDERIAFLLRRVEGLTVSEVADRMNTSLSTAKRRLLAAEGRFDRAVARRPLSEAAGRAETAARLSDEMEQRSHHD